MTKEKDISAKKLESEDDVFADIFNSILFWRSAGYRSSEATR